MNYRFVRPALFGGLTALAACSVAASRAPLGGNYAITEEAPSHDRTPHNTAPEIEPAPDPEFTPEPVKSVAAILPLEDAGAPVLNTNLLRYDPLQVGAKIQAELAVSFELGLETSNASMISGDGKLAIDAKYRLNLKVTRASSQTIDELEVVVTPLLMRTRYGEHTTEEPVAPAETLQVTLGRAPSVRPPSSSGGQEEGRSALLLLCTTLADFHEHWRRTPTLELKNGWSSKNPISVPPFLNSHGETLQIGPLLATYNGRDANDGPDRVPFALKLPAKYTSAVGKYELDLSGVARLSTSQARPVAVNLSGPVTGAGGPHGELSAHGFTKFEATLSYP